MPQEGIAQPLEGKIRTDQIFVNENNITNQTLINTGLLFLHNNFFKLNVPGE
jgi:hypothetical protein